MNLIKNIIDFFKKIFNKQNTIKMIKKPIESSKQDDKNNFLNSLKENTTQKKKKKKIETLTCFGDGTGVNNKITY